MPTDTLQSVNKISSLFELCVDFVSVSVRNIDSLVGFPDVVGEKIFSAVRTLRTLQSLEDPDCARVLRTFDEAYHASLLSELSIRSLVAIDRRLESFSTFRHVTRLDVAGCTLGDNHDFLLHIGHLPRLVDLVLRNTAVSDNGLQRLTTPVRMFGRGPTELVRLDVSYNPGISSRCGKYLQTLKQLKLLNVSETAVELSDIGELMSSLSLVMYTDISADSALTLPHVGNIGWAAEIVDDWNASESHLKSFRSDAQPQSAAGGSSLIHCSNFYSNRSRVLSKLEAVATEPVDDSSLVLVRRTDEQTNTWTGSQKQRLVAENYSLMNKVDVDVIPDEHSEQWMSLYRQESHSTGKSAAVGKTCSGLFDAMNSSRW